jgi:hypothetical protein
MPSSQCGQPRCHIKLTFGTCNNAQLDACDA